MPYRCTLLFLGWLLTAIQLHGLQILSFSQSHISYAHCGHRYRTTVLHAVDSDGRLVDSGRNRLPTKLSAALQIYYQLFESSAVHVAYKVPQESADWPDHLLGYNLGLRLRIFRKQHGTKIYLDEEHQIEFSNMVHVKKYDFQAVAMAWSIYKIWNNGSTAIAANFTVPNRAPWPEFCWGMPLTHKIKAIRAGTLYNKPWQVSQLNDIGFIWSPADVQADSVLRAVKSYKTLYGHVRIPSSFIVPVSDYFPDDTWGMKLGWRLNNYRYRGDFAQYRREFEKLGVSREKVGIDLRSFDSIYYALEVYKFNHHNVNIPRKWSVPEDKSWPSELWGLKLGYRLHNIRYRGDYVRDNETCKDMLLDLGVRFPAAKKNPEVLVFHETEAVGYD